MAERTMYALPGSASARVDELIASINVELEKLGLKKANRTTILRALIFCPSMLVILIFIINFKSTQHLNREFIKFNSNDLILLYNQI